MARLTGSGEGAGMNKRKGFTLIELMVVLAIVGLLSAIVAPRYFKSVDRAREASLRTSLNVMRDAIDKYVADKGRYPDSLDDLAEKRYIREVPEDPVTGRRDSWLMMPPPAGSTVPGLMSDVRSGAAGEGLDGQPYQSY